MSRLDVWTAVAMAIQDADPFLSYGTLNRYTESIIKNLPEYGYSVQPVPFTEHEKNCPDCRATKGTSAEGMAHK